MPSTWEDKIVSPERAMAKIRPGMSIFIGTGMAEPRTLVKALMESSAGNLQDLELIQLVSMGDAISVKELRTQKYRLKTFFTGWVAGEAITEGQVDLIPSRFAQIPALIESGRIPIDASFVQITPPDASGNCSLGVAVDVARQAMEQSSLVVGEISTQTPRTYGDTFVHVSDFNYMVRATEPPLYYNRWPVDEPYNRLAANVASLIEDRSCIFFSIGPLYEALSLSLSGKRHLGIHSPFFTDALMDLVRSGAVSNRYKETYRGKALASYAIGTPRLMLWLDSNPLVEFQSIDKVFDPLQIGRNPRFMAILPARKVDLAGRIALQIGKGNIATGPAEVRDFFAGAEISSQGRLMFALPSRNLAGRPNILLTARDYPNQCRLRESVDTIITDYGVASLKGLTLRERALALIEIAHPDDQAELIEQAKAEKILYPDQIYRQGSAHLYPADLKAEHTFKGGVTIRFRPIKPTDEEEMRRLFYRVSDESVYARYFGHITTMPHAKMQEYVNVDWSNTLSIVGLIREPGQGQIVAETRYIIERNRPWAEVVFIVDERYQGLGVGTFLYEMLVQLGQTRGLKGFTADVLFSNLGMMKVFRKGALPVQAVLENGIYHLNIPFEK